MSDIEFAKYLIEKLAPELRADITFSDHAEDVEDAGHRLLHAAEIFHTLADLVKT
jgi:hypothetical protein